MLPFGVAARNIGVPLDDHAEKRLRHAQIAGRVDDFTAQRLAVQHKITIECADDLGDRRICVTILKHILALG